MWFGHDADWVTKADTKGTGRCVSLSIYRYRVRGCLKRAYFFSLLVWGLEFTYLSNGLNTKNIMIFLPGELETFPNIRLYQNVLLGSTKLSYHDFLFIIENLSFSGSSNALTSILKRKTTQPASSSASRCISRSSSIGHELNITISQSHSPTNLSRCDYSMTTSPNQRVFIMSLSFRLLNTNNACSIMAKLVTNASPSNFYLGRKMLGGKHFTNGLIIYVGNDSYKLIETSYVDLILSSRANAVQYFRLLSGNSADQLLVSIKQRLQDLSEQPTHQPADQVERKEDHSSSVQKTNEDQINEGANTDIKASKNASVSANTNTDVRLSTETKYGSPDHTTETKPLIGQTMQTPRTAKRQNIHKANQQAVASPKQKALKRGNQPLSPAPAPAPICASDSSMDVTAPLPLIEITAPPSKLYNFLAPSFDPFPVRQLSKGKHSRMRSAGAVDDTPKELSEDSCLDELINVQPYMRSERIISNQATSFTDNSEESVDIIVDNVGMSSRNYLPVIKTQAETATALWGQTTARSMVHGGSI